MYAGRLPEGDRMALYIKNARTAGGEPLELILENGKILASGPRLVPPPGCETLDARGMTAAAGVLDMHVHLREPGFEYKEDIESGGRAAAAGGVTAVACMPNTKPVTDTPERVRYVLDRAAAASPVRVLPIAAISAGEKGETLTDFEALAHSGAAAFSDDGVPVMSDELMRAAMLRAKPLGLPVISHCEDFGFTEPYPASHRHPLLGDDLMITNMEESMAARDIALAIETGAPVHIAHISTAVSAELVRRAKRLGAPVTCETCPHYLLLDESAVAAFGANAKMNPPLRTARDRAAMLDAVCDGTVDAIVTDHAPHSAEEKARPLESAPNGIIGLETLVGGALTALRGRLPLEKILEKLTAAPHRILGLEAPSLEPGSAADITLIDPDERWTLRAEDIRSKSKNSPFIGMEFVGRANVTIVNGKTVFVR